MSAPENVEEPRRCSRWLLAVVSLCLMLSLAVAESPKKEMSEAERQAKLQEGKRLWTETRKLRAAGKLPEAILVAEKMLTLARELFGDRNADVVQSLQWLGQMHQQQNDFKAAGKRLREVLDLQTVRYGQDDWHVTDARLALAEAALRDKLNDEQRKQLAEADRLNGQLDALYRKGRNREAILLVGRVLALRKQVLGEKHADYSASLNNLALLYDSMGDYAKAEPLYLQALAIRKQVLGEQHPDYATNLNNLALLYYAMGGYAKAEPLYLQSRAIRKQALGEKHADYAASLHNLATLYHSMGGYAKAEPLYRQASAILKQVLGEKHPAYATSLNNLAALYESMGDYAKAEPLYRQASAILKQVLGEKHPAYAASLNNLAALYYAMDDHAKAEPLFRLASAILKQVSGEQHADYATSLNNLAALYESMGDYTKAEPLYRQALAIRKQALGEQHPDYAASLNNLALLDYAMGDYAKAESLYLQALAIRKQVLGEQHPDYAANLNNLATLYDSMGGYAKAEPLYRQALKISRQSLRRTAAVQSERQQLRMEGAFRYRLNNYLSAVVQAQAKAKLPDDTTLPALYEHVLAWKGAVFMRQRRQRLTRRHPELTALFDKLQDVSRRLATRALAVPAAEHRDTWRDDIANLTKQKEDLEGELANRCAAFDRDRQLARMTVKDLQAALSVDAVLVDFLEYWQNRPDAKKPGNRIWERRMAAFVVRRGQPLVLKELGAANDIIEAITEWRRAITRKTDGHSGSGPAGRLRRLLWQPLAEAIGDAAVVLVSPDGVIGFFPFAALPGDKNDHYLIEERSIALVTVPQLLPQLLQAEATDKKDAPPSLLLIGDVDFDAGAGKPELADASRSAARGPPQGTIGRFPPLAGTRGEILALRELFERRYSDADVKVLRGGAATEDALRHLAPRSRYLHLATHGFYAPPSLRSALAAPNPKKMAMLQVQGRETLGRLGVSGYHPGLLSGLALAGANGEAKPGMDDGILTAMEVATLDLDGVDLVVLSACETGLGQVADGEGMLGLQRAFQESGAHTVVAGLWQVPDQATRVLMERFYTNLWHKKMGRLAALHEAQLWMLREGRQQPELRRGLERVRDEPEEAAAKRLPPYYWAAFVLSGDWR